MTRYVVGFCFGKSGSRVALILKNRPEWMKGRYNGVGGKIELYDPSPADAMVREFLEETGVATTPDDWTLMAEMQGGDSFIYVFKAFNNHYVEKVKTTTDELVNVLVVEDIMDGYYNSSSFIPNVKWLIPMAIHGEELHKAVMQIFFQPRIESLEAEISHKKGTVFYE